MKPKTVGRAGVRAAPPCPQPLPRPDGGLAQGTCVLTADGEIPVEFLTPGDRIITRDAGMARLDRMAIRRRAVRAILFTAGSPGHRGPRTHTLLPAGQRLLIRDWRAQAFGGASQALMRADMLVDGRFVRDLGMRRLRLFRLEFDAAHVIYAGGLELAADISGRTGMRQAA
ncbi:MAG: Hint domain-containing protein [Rhodobacteraceae bacterium]|nr:Hint domain-containing protein [Paracoccaceae bacterium]